jgi:HEAT repeat protein
MRTLRHILSAFLFVIPVAMSASVEVPQSTTSELIAQLSHPNPQVQAKAVEQLGELGDRAAVEPILKLLVANSDRSLQWNIIRALEKLHDVRAIPGLILVLGTSDDYSSRFDASRALGSFGAEAVDLLLSELRNPNPEIRAGVADALGRIKDPRTARALGVVIQDSVDAVRETAAKALAEIGATEALNPLLKAATDPSPNVRAASMHALGTVNESKAVDAIVAGLKDPNPFVRSSAARSLDGGLPEGLTPLIDALSDKDPSVRSAAVSSLGSFKYPQAAAALKEALNDSALTIRMDAVRALAKLGELDVRILLPLVRNDKDSLVRDEAARAVASLGPTGVDALLQLTAADAQTRAAVATGLGASKDNRAIVGLEKFTHDGDLGVRLSAAHALGNIGTAEAVPLMMVLLKDPDRFVRNEVGNAIARVGAPALPALVDALHGDDAELRDSATHALSQIRAPGKMAELLKDDTPQVRAAAAMALQQFLIFSESIDPQLRVQLLAAVNDSDGRVRQAALSALTFKPAADLVPYVIARLHDTDPQVRLLALSSLRTIPARFSYNEIADLIADPEASVRVAAAEAIANLADEEALSILNQAMQDRDSKVRYWATYGFGNVGPKGTAALLKALTVDPDPGVQSEAARKLGKQRNVAAIEPLIQHLASKSWNHADVAAEALQSIGAPAVPALVGALNHSDADVRELAAESLGVIGKPESTVALIRALADPDSFVRSAAASALGKFAEPAAVPLLQAAQDTESGMSEKAKLALRFLASGPSGDVLRDGTVDSGTVRNRLRSYYENSQYASTYFKLSEICGPELCLQKYSVPDFPPLPTTRRTGTTTVIGSDGRTREYDAKGMLMRDASSDVRRIEADLSIDGSGKVQAISFDNAQLAGTTIEATLRSWKFGGFSKDAIFPLHYKVSLEFSAEGRPRYRYGRAAAEFGFGFVRVKTHPGLPYID